MNGDRLLARPEMELPENIAAVTFDAGGTLIEPSPSVGHVYAAVAAEHGHPNCDPARLNRSFREAWRAKKGFDYSKLAWAEIVAATFAAPDSAAERVDFFEALYERFAQPSAWRIYDDVVPCLAWLREHSFRIGLISNWDERLAPLLRRLGLARYFQATLISFEFGFHKPDRELFDEAARKLALSPSHILHVGDSAAEDYGGATAAGFSALLLRRDGSASGVETISSLAEIPALLARGH